MAKSASSSESWANELQTPDSELRTGISPRRRKEHKVRNEIRFGVHGDDKRRVTPPIAANEKKRPALAGLATKVGRTASVPSQ